MTIPYLILHKVRGEAAFDVAEPFEVNDQTWWIVSTSGHRAYPYKKWKLRDLLPNEDTGHSLGELYNDEIKHLPDHYPVTTRFRPKPRDLTNEELLAIIKEKLDV